MITWKIAVAGWVSLALLFVIVGTWVETMPRPRVPPREPWWMVPCIAGLDATLVVVSVVVVWNLLWIVWSWALR